jgi:hypothetical protein
MSIFIDDEDHNFDWQNLDVQAIVNHHGLATIDETLRPQCLDWLQKHDYRVAQIDCTKGMKAFLQSLGELFRWEEMFGYKLENSQARSLDALNDGFQFNVASTGGVVLELFRPDLIWQEDRDYLMGVLNIACHHSHKHLACGRRFFTLLVLPEESPLFGERVSLAGVPFPHGFNSLFREPGWRARLRQDFQSPEKAASQIQGWIPVGTPLSDAKHLMEAQGYTCELIKNGKFNGLNNIDYLDCYLRSSGIGQVCREAALILTEDKVSNIHARTRFTG